jgi:hypothetical protein
MKDINNPFSKKKISFWKMWILLNIVSIGLKIFGLIRCMRFFKRLSNLLKRKPEQSDPVKYLQQLSGYVHIISQYTLFRCKCLETSLVIWFLALKSGIESDLKIGTRIADGCFQAHAWVEVQNKVVSEQVNPNNKYVPFKEGMNNLINCSKK